MPRQVPAHGAPGGASVTLPTTGGGAPRNQVTCTEVGDREEGVEWTPHTKEPMGACATPPAHDGKKGTFTPPPQPDWPVV